MDMQMINNKKYKKNTITIFDLYMKLIFIMPVIALAQNKIDFINRLFFAVIFIFEIVILAKTKIENKTVILLAIAIVEYIISLIVTNNLTFNNEIIYYINFILYANIIILRKDNIKRWICNSRGYMHLMALIWTVLVFISIFMSSSYYIKEGGEKYFGSFMGSIFRLGPTALFISTIALILITVYKEKKAILYMLLPIYSVFMGSSRTYFACVIFVFIIGLYFICKNKKMFIFCMAVCLCFGIFVFGDSAMGEKVAYTLDDENYGDFWFRVTSGRSEIWHNIISSFRKEPKWEILVGAGYGFSGNVANHIAHNDFIEIFVTYGVVGIGVYLITIFSLFKNFINKKTPLIITLCCFLTWFINAMFNMFYPYICAALAFPLMMVAVEYISENMKLGKKHIKIKL